jgi:hyperosmotically inducible protein
MKSTFLGRILVASVLLAGVATAAKRIPLPQTDEQIAKEVRHEIVTYSRYTIFDDVNFRVANGQVELVGAVTEPVKKDELEHAVRKVAGVTGVINNIEVLPLSEFDNQLRRQIAHAIYSDSGLQQYALMAMPPIHIIVDNGHVTLTGMVMSDMDKQLAGMAANGAGLSLGTVTNNLLVENTSK